jgi:hypothetical protein
MSPTEAEEGWGTKDVVIIKFDRTLGLGQIVHDCHHDAPRTKKNFFAQVNARFWSMGGWI